MENVKTAEWRVRLVPVRSQLRVVTSFKRQLGAMMSFHRQLRVVVLITVVCRWVDR
jgi:hypothetical protein